MQELHNIEGVSNTKLYKGFTRKKSILIMLLIIMTFVFAILALNVGSAKLSPFQIIRALFSFGTRAV